MPPSSAIERDKAALRLLMRGRLLGLADADRRRASAAIVEQLVATPQWKRARSVLLFAPLRSEPDLDLLWTHASLADKRRAYPRVAGDCLRLYRVSALEDLRAGTSPLREPPDRRENELSIERVDLILVPGLAFTPGGDRLGRGGGHYDRLLSSAAKATSRMGIAFGFQLQPTLPTADHDAPVDVVITGERPLNRRTPSGDELDEDDDNRQHQQDVNEAANGAPAD